MVDLTCIDYIVEYKNKDSYWQYTLYWTMARCAVNTASNLCIKISYLSAIYLIKYNLWKH